MTLATRPSRTHASNAGKYVCMNMHEGACTHKHAKNLSLIPRPSSMWPGNKVTWLVGVCNEYPMFEIKYMSSVNQVKAKVGGHFSVPVDDIHMHFIHSDLLEAQAQN